MAYYRKREGKRGIRWQATVRKGGQKPQTQSFRTKGEAMAWATAIEAAINQGQLMPSKEAKRRTVRDLLERYKETELPKKKDQINTRRHVDYWIDEIGDVRLQHLRPSVIVEIRQLLEHADFQLTNPNKVRSLIAVFARSNLINFHRKDGEGYILVADLIIKLNRINPQIAARLTANFNRWRHYDEIRQLQMQKQLQRIVDLKSISADVYEIASKALA